MQALVEELLRYRAALKIQRELERLSAAHLPCSGAADARGLLPAAIFEGHQNGATAAAQTTREWVHPILDVHRRATVVEVAAPSSPPRRLAAVRYVPGDILGVLEPLAGDATGATVESAVPLAQLRLASPAPLYADALLPALEAIEPHHASKNLLDLWLTKLCGAANKMDSSFNQKRKKAWQLTDEATCVFYEARKELAQQVAAVRQLRRGDGTDTTPWHLAVRLCTDTAQLREKLQQLALVRPSESGETAVVIDVTEATNANGVPRVREWLAPPHSTAQQRSEVEWTASLSSPEEAVQLRIPICPSALLRLLTRYNGTKENFLPVVARLLLRYHGLCGGNMEGESGWHAAVPSSVMDAFEHHGTVSPCASPPTVVECFASPFNTTRRYFFSVFPDTDAPFGSLGNFFACPSAAACIAAAEGDADNKTPPCGVVGEGPAAAVQLPVVRLLRLECNPPFDHEVIAAAFSHLLCWMDSAPPSVALSVLIIFPDSTQPRAAAVRSAMEKSPFCRWVSSAAPAACLYVHGAQQRADASVRLPRRKRERDADVGTGPRGEDGTCSLIQLSCATRLLVVQNAAAEQDQPGAVLGIAVRDAWSALSAAKG